MIERCDVLVVGAGPAGLAAATQLRQRAVGSVIVIDRETRAGGIPRHCLHSPFGMREFTRVLSGPAYARALAQRAQAIGAEIRLGTSLVALDRQEEIIATVTSNDGVTQLAPRRVLLATGVRETPRSARLIGGERPLGVMTTGALQLYAERGLMPFRRPVIVGTELVALSALLTCRALGARPVLMAEPNARPTVRRAFMALPLLLGVPVRYGAMLERIDGNPRVENVSIALSDGPSRDVACDGVVLTGHFRPEATVAQRAGLEIDPGTRGPSVDQFGRTTDPRIFAAGNMLHPVETAGWCWAEARRIAGFLAESLSGALPAGGDTVPIGVGPGIAYVMPQRLAGAAPGLGGLQLRVTEPHRGRIVTMGCDVVQHSGGYRQRLPERRIEVPVPRIPGDGSSLTILLKA